MKMAVLISEFLSDIKTMCPKQNDAIELPGRPLSALPITSRNFVSGNVTPTRAWQ